MQSDSAYLSQYPAMLALLRESSGGDFARIPDSYLENFLHRYANGDISLLPAISNLTNTEFAEDWQIEEAVETLSRVNPLEWPNCEDIESIDFEELLCENDIEYDFVEDNLGTSEKVEKVLKSVIESVFGKGVTTIRDEKGNFPSPGNNFLQEEDGTFAGTFMFGAHKFKFEIAPSEAGWLCTYRVAESTLDKLERPMYKNKRKDLAQDLKSVRSKAWR